jgi:hypothetical protein
MRNRKKIPQIYQRKSIYEIQTPTTDIQPPREITKTKQSEKEKQTTPLTISTVPYPLQQNQKREKPVQSRHPLQASTQINSTGPALHTAESHTGSI